jgi:hypothetical protein
MQAARHQSRHERADSRSDCTRTAESPGAAGNRRRPREPPDQPPGRAQCAPALASLVGFYGGSGLGGLPNPPGSSNVSPGTPTDLPGTWQNTFNNSSPDYFVGLNLNIPFRNRVAKADQYRSELEYRQASLRGAVEKTDSDRSSQRTICAGTIARPGGIGAQGQGSWQNAPLGLRRKSKTWDQARVTRP